MSRHNSSLLACLPRTEHSARPEEALNKLWSNEWMKKLTEIVHLLHMYFILIKQTKTCQLIWLMVLVLASSTVDGRALFFTEQTFSLHWGWWWWWRFNSDNPHTGPVLPEKSMNLPPASKAKRYGSLGQGFWAMVLSHSLIHWNHNNEQHRVTDLTSNIWKSKN